MSKSVASGCFGIGTSDCIQEFFVITLIKNTQLRMPQCSHQAVGLGILVQNKKLTNKDSGELKRGKAMLVTIEIEDKWQIFRQQLRYG